MHIIQIGQYPLNPTLIRGGVESSIYGLVGELAESINQVTVIDIPRLNGFDTLETISGVRVYRFRNNGKRQKDSSKRIPDIIEVVSRLKPSICHIHGTSIFCSNLLKALNSKGFSTIITVHGLARVEKKKALFQHISLKNIYQFITHSFAEMRILSTVEQAIVDTGYVKDMVAHYGIARLPQMEIIPQGINERFFHLSCSRSSRDLLSVGAFTKRKGHLFLIKAFEILCQRVSDVHLTICGSLSDREYYLAIKEYVYGSACRDHITLQTDISREELYSMYTNAHVFALHSQEESQGIALVEAMAVGLPIVSTRVGGIPYVVSHGITGLLSDYGDIVSFADSLERVFQSDDYWGFLSKNCRSASSIYNWNSIANRVVEVYHSIIQ